MAKKPRNLTSSDPSQHSVRLTIGKLARHAEVNVETIRYYQRIGLLDVPDKRPGGVRSYPVGYIARIHFIKRAQQLGFTLREVAELLSLGDGHCDDVRTLAEQKRARIEGQIKDLNAMCEVLDRLIDGCLEDHDGGHCSLIHALSDRTDNST